MQPIPISGPVVNWLRDEASQPFVQGRQGADDDIPLGWLPQLASSDKRVPDAIVQLLGEGDPVVTSRIVAVAAVSDAAPLKGAVARAIGKSAKVLAGVQRTWCRRLRNLATATARRRDDRLFDQDLPSRGWMAIVASNRDRCRLRTRR